LEKIHKLADLITRDLSDVEKVITIDSLNKILTNIKNIKI